MLSEALLKTARELMRQSQNGTYPISLLAERLCMLLRVTALKSEDPRVDVVQIRDELEPFIPELCILDAITGQVMEVLEGEDISRSAIEPELDSLLEEVREADSELSEQLSSLFNAGDDVIVLSEREGGYVEASLQDAADGIADEKAGRGLNVTILAVQPDHEGHAEAMAERLHGVKGVSVNVITDAYVTAAMQKCNKVVLSALAMDVDDGGLCYPGSALVCSAANRMRVPVVLALPKHRLVPVGSGSVSMMSRTRRHPGKIWDYEQARDDRDRDAITVVFPAYDLVALQKCEMVVTEFGGYAPEYVKSLAPNFDSSPEEGQG